MLSVRIPLVSGLAVLLTVSGPPCWGQAVTPQVSISSLTFSAIADGPTPPVQVFTVSSSDGSPLSFAVLADGGAAGVAAPAWLTVPRTLATTPAQIRVSVDQTGLIAGSYPARILLTDAQGRSLGVVVSLTLNVLQGTAQLGVTPARVSLAGALSAGTIQQGVLVRNLGPGTIAPVSVSVPSGSRWLSGVVDSPDTCDKVCVVLIRAFAGAMMPGAYLGAVRISTAIGSQDVPVSFLVSDHSALLQPGADNLAFEVVQGIGLPDTRSLALLNIGDLQSVWAADIIDGKSWLSVAPTSGNTEAGATTMVTVSMNPGNLTAGTYGGLIRISFLGASNAALYIPVVLRVNAASTPAVPLLSNGGLLITPGAGGLLVQPQLTLAAASANAIAFQVSIQNANWLSVTPPHGQVSSSQAVQLNIGADGNNLSPGFYSGLINVAFGNAAFRTLNVGFVPLSSDTCVAQNLHLVETGTPDGFAARTTFPLPLDSTMVDDCGTPVSNGTVFATFSNGDAGITLRGIGKGRYVQSWTPSTSSGSLPNGTVSVALRAFAPGYKPTSQELVGTVSSDNLPAIRAGGVVNNFNPQPGAPLAPGTAVQIFGSAFGTSTAQGAIANGRLATNLGGVSVKIGGIDAPLYYTSAGQINAQLPAELLPNRQHQVIVNVNGVYSKPEPINVIATQPGIAVYPDTHAIAQDTSYNLITTQNPAHAGDVVVLYLTGMGGTNPPVPTGSPAPSATLAVVNFQPQVTIDGAPAEVIFAGLSPGSVGLYQIDARVPDGAKAGDLAVVVTQNGASSNVALLPVR